MTPTLCCLFCQQEFRRKGFWRHLREHRLVWTRFTPGDPEDCWLWTGAQDAKGYGRVRLGVRYATSGIGAHRYVYEAMRGSVAPELHMDHLCRTPLCVNPSHLEPVVPIENWRRGESPTRRLATQTHCKRGHSLSGDNLYLWRGSRICRACRKARQEAAA